MKRKKVTWPQARAFSVHLLTASGSFLAFLSLVAASEQRWTAMTLGIRVSIVIIGGGAVYHVMRAFLRRRR